MSLVSGQRAEFLNVLDHQMADDLQPMFSIDVTLSKSPKMKVKCGAITVYRLNMVNLELPDSITKNPLALKEAQEAQLKASTQTEIMHMDPILFKESEGRWIAWALGRALELYDQVGGSSRIAIKCPKLHIEQRRSSKAVAMHRSDLRSLFPVAWDIDRLLDGDFSYDPWSNRVRRGRINAEMSKR